MANRLTKILNSFFPGVSGFGLPSKDAKITSNIENDGKNLNRYRAPVQVVRLKVDTSYWKSAVAEAERPLAALPYRVQMQTIFLDTVLNGHVFACMQKRKNLVLLKKFEIVDEQGNVDEEATKLLDTKWFHQLREYIQDAQYYGYSLITFGDLIDGEFPKLAITRRTDVSPDRECLSTQPYVPTGINFNDPTYVSPNGEKPYDWSLWVTTPSENGVSTCGYGILYKVAVYEIIMRSLLGWNTDYAERFGMPTTVIKTIDDSETERGRAEDAAKSLAHNGYLILDVNDEYIPTPSGDSGTGWQSYDNLEQRCKKTIAAIILGHEDGISSSAGKLTSDNDESPQQKALIDCETIDTRFEENIINDILYAKLIKLGFKLPPGKKYRVKNDAEKHEENEHKAEQAKTWADVALTLSQAGLKVDINEFAELSGIKMSEAPAIGPVPQMSAKVKTKLMNTYAGTKKEKS